MPIVTINLLQGREPERKAALLRAVTDAVVQTLQVPPQSVRVLLNEMPAEHWAVGGVSKAEG